MLIACLFLGTVLLACLSGLPGLFLGREGRPVASFLLGASALGGLAVAGLVLYGGGTSQLALPWALPQARFLFRIDAPAAFFLVPVTLVPAILARYGNAYWDDAEHPEAPRLRLFFGLTTGAMAALTAASNALLFLFAWEIMALMGFFMIASEDREASVREAGWIYLVATHAGTLCLFAGFSLLASALGTMDLGPLPPGFASSPQGTAAFLLLLVGFGLKAGLVPFHIWLPVAHAAAPSHVSALLSGLMIKMGLLGIFRILCWTPDPPLWWGGLLLGLGALSGILGLAWALGQRDLKRMLAFSSIENVGIITLGLGLATAGKATGNGTLVVLGGGGALFHLLNHALFKPLLFMGAGSVMHGAGTRNLESLGGLAKGMPKTAALFLVGAAAISGLPPLNGFAGEWLLYLGGFRALGPPGWVWAVIPVVSLAVIGALAVAAFTRAYGVVFLGAARTAAAELAHESPREMIQAMGVLAGLCALLGLFPVLLRPALDRLAQALGGPGLPPLASLGSLGVLTLVALLLLPTAAFLWKVIQRTSRTRSVTWDCGYHAPTARIQYTASSFGQMLTDAFRFVLLPKVHRPRIQGLFPRRGTFLSLFPDPVLDRTLLPLSRFSAWLLSWLKVLQGGQLSIYLVYIVLILVALFAWTLA